MTDPGNSVPGHWQRWIPAALIASLALNLLVVGAMAGSFWVSHHRGHGWGGRDHPREHGLMAFARTLEPERAKTIRKAIEDERARLQPLREEMRNARTAAGKVLVVEPFDKAKFKDALRLVADADAKYKQASYEILAETTEKLSPEERKAFQEWRDRRIERRFRKRPAAN